VSSLRVLSDPPPHGRHATIASLLASRARPPLEWPTVWRLAGIGALVGGGTGALLVALSWAEPLGLSGVWPGILIGVEVGAPVGAVCGSLLAPIAGLLFLRDVPLWLAVLSPAGGTVIGGSLGLVTSLWFALDVLGPDPVRGALGGFVLGVIAARLLAPQLQPRQKR
jgi:hypothetical protein